MARNIPNLKKRNGRSADPLLSWWKIIPKRGHSQDYHLQTLCMKQLLKGASLVSQLFFIAEMQNSWDQFDQHACILSELLKGMDIVRFMLMSEEQTLLDLQMHWEKLMI